MLALEPKIEDAVVRGDVAFVDSVLAPDFSFVHGDSWTLGGKPLASDDKAAFLKRVADKEYLVHDLDGVKAEVHGDIVITYGRYLSLYMPKPQNAIPNATPGKLNSIWFERVYAKRNGQWQFADKRYKLGATTMGGRTMSQSASYVNLRVAVGRARGGFKTRISGGRRIQGNVAFGANTRIPTVLLRRRSERVHLACEVRDGGGYRRGAGRQAEAVQNFSCRIGRMYCCNNFHPASATFALKNVHQENTFHQLRPDIVAIARRWQSVRRRLGINSRHR